MEVFDKVKKVLNMTTLLTIMAVLLLTIFVPQQAKADESLNIMADAAILVDADTGKILYEKNASAPLGIASMSKMMTEYLLFEAIEEGRIKWDQKYTVTDYTHKVSQDMRLSNVPLRLGEAYSIQELYEAMAIYSANAATIGIAETIAGTESEFVTLMNEKAKEMGLEDVKFVNSTGLNNADLMGMHPKESGEKDENVMSARSVAKLAKALLDTYPEVLETTKIPVKTFREGTADATRMDNWNYMLPGLDFPYEGVDGLKTGTTDFAGHSFTGTAKRGETRLIAVVMKAVDSEGVGSYKARFDATRALFDFGFNQFTTEEIVPAGYQFQGNETLPITKGKEDSVNIVVQEPVSMLIRTSDKESYKPELVLDNSLVKAGELEASVEKDQVVGTVKIVKEDGEDYGYLNDNASAVKVVTAEKVERASWFSLSLQAVGSFFSSMWGGATDFVKGLI
ncbi:D-alanyl-D-alanine carboxypeptidase family protein [Planomicrobium sp. CPCC 101079]|uniref:D-alanyl-D-alanine carboxypeptidase family protein n=1 Tax=Planomicrobium sp. CPCC 101079 TaxID=2599618 RepID=UPI0011B6EFD6|nr:D-alanyl-D-alanine carboxypeptidase family protein [Planomicrobium sp. CPCC 101079]TWT05857.1 D-alanyl-D-alanine carboxypeptidase [Planomicrobium sp. CPCC 101079]